MGEDQNPNIRVEITDSSEFHCFRLTFNPQALPDGEQPHIEIMLHARSLVDLIHKCSISLCNWQAQTSAYLMDRIKAYK